MNVFKEGKLKNNFISSKYSWSDLLSIALNLFSFLLFVYMVSTCWNSVTFAENFVALVCMVTLIYYFPKKIYAKQPIFKLALIFFFIFAFSEMIYCGLNFENSYSYITRIAFSTCIAFPFFSNFKEWTKRKILKIIIILSVTCAFIFSLVAICISIYPESNINQLLGSIIYINDKGRLYSALWHPNKEASMLGISFMFSLYMVFIKTKKTATVFWISACIVLFYTISLTGARTVMFGIAFCSAVVFSHYLISMLQPAKNRILKIVLVIIAIIILILVLFFCYKQIVSFTNSSASENKQIALRKLDLETLMSLNNRTTIYKAGIKTSLSSFKSLFFGYPVKEYMPLVNKNAPTGYYYSSMHNALLQVLLETGIIGFLVAICLCIIILFRCLKIVLNSNQQIERKIIALIPIFILIQSILEPSILSPVHYVIDIPFFLLSGFIFSSKIENV